MSIFYILLALTAGVLQALQAAINSLLGKEVDNPVFAAFVSGILSGAVLGLYLLCTRDVLPKGFAAALHLPWWLWLGGLLGAAYLTALVLATLKLGTGTVMALVIVTQVAASVAMDHFAVFGLEPRPASWPRLAGVLCFGLGAFLIQHF